MTHRRAVTSALTLAALAAAASTGEGQEFEGAVKTRSITIDVESLRDRTGGDPARLFEIPIEEILRLPDADVQEFTHYLKGSRFRTQPMGDSENATYVVVDYATGVFRTVQTAERVYMEWGMEDIERMRQQMQGMRQEGMPRPASGPEPTLHPLGQTRVINGVRCTGFELRQEGELTRAWVTTEHGDALRAFLRFSEQVERMNPMEEDAHDDPAELYLRHGLPILTQGVGLLEGDVEGSYDIEEVLSIERTSLPDSLFEPPAGFRKMTMQEMMGDMMRQPPPPQRPPLHQ
jgi:hypothetical protein